MLNTADELELRIYVNQLFQQAELSDTEAVIFYEIFFKGHTYLAAARRYYISESRAWQACQRALAKLRRAINRDDFLQARFKARQKGTNEKKQKDS